MGDPTYQKAQRVPRLVSAAVEEQFDKMAEDFKMDKEQIKGMFGEEQMAQLKEDLAVQKAIDFLVAEAKFVD